MVKGGQLEMRESQVETELREIWDFQDLQVHPVMMETMAKTVVMVTL
jgi:hypothetical protein